MKFSVVMPSLNQADFLAGSVRSVLEQRGDFEVECVVMDGGSADRTMEVLRELEALRLPAGRTLQWFSEPDRGQADALNKGFRRATGDVLAYLNSDDRYDADALRRVAEALRRAPESPWLTGRCRIVNTDGAEIQRGVTAYRNFWLGRYSYTALRMLNFIAQPATFWRRAAAAAIGPFDETLSYTMDYDYWLRLGKYGDPVILREYLAEFRIHRRSKGATAYRRQFREDYSTFLRSNPGPGLRAFHRVHNALVVSAYRVLK